MYGVSGSLFTHHIGQANPKRLSPRIWTHLADGSDPSGDGGWRFIFDDFLNFGLTTAVSSNVGRYASEGGCYKTWEDNSASVAALATLIGAVQLATPATDNLEVWMQSGGSTGVLGVISDTPADARKLLFEARFRLNKVTDTGNAFIGLAEEGLAAENTIADDPSTNKMADKDYIGFNVSESDGDALKFVYNKAGAGTTGQQTIAIANAKALAADTWYKAGFVYDPDSPTSERIRVYVDNVENGTRVTGGNIAATAFPDGEELAFLCGIKNGSAAITQMVVDWWGFAQQV